MYLIRNELSIKVSNYKRAIIIKIKLETNRVKNQKILKIQSLKHQDRNKKPDLELKDM